MSLTVLTESGVRPPALPQPKLGGLHHAARPTWRLEETVRFYRDIMGLKICHAISARGWGPENHPDFLHFFFDAGNGATIAFFYYLRTDEPAEAMPQDSVLYRASHTAWRVDTREELLAWRARFEAQGFEVMQVRHEIIESIYVDDPNGYLVEIAWQIRPMTEADGTDATLTLEAAIDVERTTGRRVETIDDIWRGKAALVKRHAEKDE